VISCASDLVYTCQHDKPKMRSLLASTNQMIDRGRDCKDTHIHFYGNGLDVSIMVKMICQKIQDPGLLPK
jgi:hypothetical protein